MIQAPTFIQNNNGGNGRGYSPLKKAKKEEEKLSVTDLNHFNDPRMRFKNSRDPIYVAFDYVQRQSVKSLAKNFVKDILSDSLYFISQVV